MPPRWGFIYLRFSLPSAHALGYIILRPPALEFEGLREDSP